MKLFANENFPYKSIYYLKEKGYNVLSIGMNNPSILDSEIMKIAINEERIIMTFDRDYGEFYNKIIQLMHELDKDLALHLHLENNILFPKAVELAKRLN